MSERVSRPMLTPEQYHYGRRDGFDPHCCATCRHAIVRGGRRGGGLRRWCDLRQAFLPLKERERLRYNGCDGHELDTASAGAIAIWNRLAPDADGWSDRDFVQLRAREAGS
jgi:hypothetical protein